MAKHKHSKMIKAKADNMDLVVFTKNCQNDGKWWALVNDESVIPSFDGDHYFACLPQHKEVCLHWLNGGDVEYKSRFTGDYWSKCYSISGWSPLIGLMREDVKYRIKPQKEKRWICINDNLEIEDGTLYGSYCDADENSLGYKQIVEIEVEI